MQQLLKQLLVLYEQAYGREKTVGALILILVANHSLNLQDLLVLIQNSIEQLKRLHVSLLVLGLLLLGLFEQLKVAVGRLTIGG